MAFFGFLGVECGKSLVFFVFVGKATRVFCGYLFFVHAFVCRLGYIIPPIRPLGRDKRLLLGADPRRRGRGGALLHGIDFLFLLSRHLRWALRLLRRFLSFGTRALVLFEASGGRGPLCCGAGSRSIVRALWTLGLVIHDPPPR